MILLLHITIALLSIAFAGYTFLSPSKTKLKISLGLVGATLATGTYLIVLSPAHMIQACTTGLFYTGIVLSASILTNNKLAKTAKQSVDQ